MRITTGPRTYSANVQLHLEVDGRTVDLAQIGPDDVIANDPIDLPPCEADVVMHVDGEERRWRVSLVNGMSRDNRVVKTVRI